MNEAAKFNWTEDCHKPDEATLWHWRTGFEYQGEKRKDWQSVYEAIDNWAPKENTEVFKADIHFAVWGFRNDYAIQKSNKPLGLNERDRAEQTAICERLLTELDNLKLMGNDFVEIGTPLKRVLVEHSAWLLSPKNRGRGRKRERARDLLVLTLADRWKRHTTQIPSGAEWTEFLTRVLKASYYIPNNSRGTGDYSDPTKLLSAATKKYTSEKLYLRNGENACPCYVFHVSQENK